MIDESTNKQMRRMMFAPHTFALAQRLYAENLPPDAFEAMYAHAVELEMSLWSARRRWWHRLKFIHVCRIESLRLTVVRWRDASTTARPMFKGKYHYIDWLLQNHGPFRGWPVGFQVWR